MDPEEKELIRNDLMNILHIPKPSASSTAVLQGEAERGQGHGYRGRGHSAGVIGHGKDNGPRGGSDHRSQNQKHNDVSEGQGPEVQGQGSGVQGQGPEVQGQGPGVQGQGSGAPEQVTRAKGHEQRTRSKSRKEEYVEMLGPMSYARAVLSTCKVLTIPSDTNIRAADAQQLSATRHSSTNHRENSNSRAADTQQLSATQHSSTNNRQSSDSRAADTQPLSATHHSSTNNRQSSNSRAADTQEQSATRHSSTNHRQSSNSRAADTQQQSATRHSSTNHRQAYNGYDNNVRYDQRRPRGSRSHHYNSSGYRNSYSCNGYQRNVDSSRYYDNMRYDSGMTYGGYNNDWNHTHRAIPDRLYTQSYAPDLSQRHARKNDYYNNRGKNNRGYYHKNKREGESGKVEGNRVEHESRKVEGCDDSKLVKSSDNTESKAEIKSSSSAAPQSVSAVPQSGSAAPQSVSAAPQSGSAAPQYGSAAPQPGSAAPQTGSTTHQSGRAAPQSGSAAPQSGCAAPQSGSAAPQSGSKNAQSISTVVTDESSKTGHGKKPARKSKRKPQNKPCHTESGAVEQRRKSGERNKARETVQEDKRKTDNRNRSQHVRQDVVTENRASDNGTAAVLNDSSKQVMLKCKDVEQVSSALDERGQVQPLSGGMESGVLDDLMGSASRVSDDVSSSGGLVDEVSTSASTSLCGTEHDIKVESQLLESGSSVNETNACSDGQSVDRKVEDRKEEEEGLEESDTHRIGWSTVEKKKVKCTCFAHLCACREEGESVVLNTENIWGELRRKMSDTTSRIQPFRNKNRSKNSGGQLDNDSDRSSGYGGKRSIRRNNHDTNHIAGALPYQKNYPRQRYQQVFDPNSMYDENGRLYSCYDRNALYGSDNGRMASWTDMNVMYGGDNGSMYSWSAGAHDSYLNTYAHGHGLGYPTGVNEPMLADRASFSHPNSLQASHQDMSNPNSLQTNHQAMSNPNSLQTNRQAMNIPNSLQANHQAMSNSRVGNENNTRFESKQLYYNRDQLIALKNNQQDFHKLWLEKNQKDFRKIGLENNQQDFNQIKPSYEDHSKQNKFSNDTNIQTSQKSSRDGNQLYENNAEQSVWNNTPVSDRSVGLVTPSTYNPAEGGWNIDPSVFRSDTSIYNELPDVVAGFPTTRSNGRHVTSASVSDNSLFHSRRNDRSMGPDYRPAGAIIKRYKGGLFNDKYTECKNERIVTGLNDTDSDSDDTSSSVCEENKCKDVPINNINNVPANNLNIVSDSMVKAIAVGNAEPIMKEAELKSDSRDTGTRSEKSFSESCLTRGVGEGGEGLGARRKQYSVRARWGGGGDDSDVEGRGRGKNERYGRGLTDSDSDSDGRRKKGRKNMKQNMNSFTGRESRDDLMSVQMDGLEPSLQMAGLGSSRQMIERFEEDEDDDMSEFYPLDAFDDLSHSLLPVESRGERGAQACSMTDLTKSVYYNSSLYMNYGEAEKSVRMMNQGVCSEYRHPEYVHPDMWRQVNGQCSRQRHPLYVPEPSCQTEQGGQAVQHRQSAEQRWNMTQVEQHGTISSVERHERVGSVEGQRERGGQGERGVQVDKSGEMIKKFLCSGANMESMFTVFARSLASSLKNDVKSDEEELSSLILHSLTSYIHSLTAQQSLPVTHTSSATVQRSTRTLQNGIGSEAVYADIASSQAEGQDQNGLLAPAQQGHQAAEAGRAQGLGFIQYQQGLGAGLAEAQLGLGAGFAQTQQDGLGAQGQQAEPSAGVAVYDGGEGGCEVWEQRQDVILWNPPAEYYNTRNVMIRGQDPETGEHIMIRLEPVNPERTSRRRRGYGRRRYRR